MPYKRIKDKKYVAKLARIHYWINTKYGKAPKCEHCGTTTNKRYEWALKKGCDYEKKRENFISLCNSCHKKYDFTEETRKKMSKTHKGRKASDEAKENIRKSKLGKKNPMYGKNLTKEHKKKISDAQKGREGCWQGKKLSKEHRKKISKSMKEYRKTMPRLV